ncbi:MAG: heavy metal-binding domain-containing protein [bacterium]
MIEIKMITTGVDIPGYKVVELLGFVQGITVREHFLVAHTDTAKVEFCVHTRAHAFDAMVAQAVELGANAIIGVRYENCIIMESYTEIIAYGTAVLVESTSEKRV